MLSHHEECMTQRGFGNALKIKPHPVNLEWYENSLLTSSSIKYNPLGQFSEGQRDIGHECEV